MKINKIAYLVNQYPKVSHTFIRREILALESLGYEVMRLSVRGWDNDLPDATDEQERLRTRYLLKDGVSSLLKAAWRVFLDRPLVLIKALRTAVSMGFHADRPWPFHVIYLLEACQALLWLREKNIQHVHAHFGGNSTEVALLIKLLNGPGYSFTVHGPEEFDKPEFIHLGFKISNAAFVVAITSFCRSQLYRWSPYAEWKKVKVVRCGIEPEFHKNLPADFPVEPRLVCVGRLCEQKGQLILLEAASKLNARGISFQLVLAGDGEMRAEIEREIDVRGLKSQVHITGWISSAQVREEILKSRALVLPSFGEGLPVVIMEAMALKRPVISTYIAGIPELVQDGVNGFLCPAGDVNRLADQMEKCLRAGSEQLTQFGERAQTSVLEMHDSMTEAKKLAAYFEVAIEAGANLQKRG